MRKNSGIVGILYGTVLGRFLLKLIMKLHLDRIAVKFLRSYWSKPFTKWYIKINNLDIPKEEILTYKSYRDFFIRTQEIADIDFTPNHLISPCDGWLSVFHIDADSRFYIKKSIYSIYDFLNDEELAKNYEDGDCLIFRIEASDHHHYCYIDDGFQGRHTMIPGMLHSVQPIACEKYPVFVLNRRCWSLLTTEHFGPVIQCEIGALIVGGIYNERENVRFRKGAEKGHFEIAGSTIVMLFEKGCIDIKEDIKEKLLADEEMRVKKGQWIGVSKKGKQP